MPKRIIIDTHGPDANGIRIAMAAAEILCGEHGCDALICVPMKNTAENGVLNQVISSAQIKKLLKGDSLMVNGKMTVRLASQKTLGSSSSRGVIIALHGSSDMMVKIDSVLDCKAIIMVPWLKEEGEAWTAKWNPTVLPGKI